MIWHARGRKRPLFVDKANPYTEVVTELKKFEKIYFSILDKTVSARNNSGYLRDWSKTKIKSYYFDDILVEKNSDDLDEFLVESSYGMYLGSQPMDIFYGFLNIYMVRLLTNWSKEIRNKDVLNKINTMIFAKFASMQKHTNKIIASISSIESIGLSYNQMQMNSLDQLKEKLTNLKVYNMEEEVNQLSEFIDGILLNEELRSYFRQKRGSLYRWDSKYKKEDKETLAEDMVRHPDWLDDYSS
jgi:hypothetical protein